MLSFFKQTASNPISVEVQTAIMWAMQNNFFDSISVSDVNRATQSLREYMETQGEEACELIYLTGKLEEETEQKLRSSVEDWKRTFS